MKNTTSNSLKSNGLLEVKSLSTSYGQVKALNEVSFRVNKGEIVAMIGPNGAGKSTALKAVASVLEEAGGKIDKGEILFNGKSIKGLNTDELVKKGLSLVPEGRHVFSSMTVLENLEMGAFTIKNKATIKEYIQRIFELFPKLKERKSQKAGTLSGGEQQMLAVGRALMLKPQLLLLDEPFLGLSPNFVEILFEKLIEINKSGTSILLVEQNARKALEICQRGYVFEIGSIALEGDRQSLIQNEKIKQVFLGG